MDIRDLMCESLLGMDRKSFERKAQLMRGPEGFEKPGYCPVCKKELHVNDKGDLFCKDFNLDYEKKGGCYWHRYADGLNYWSSPEELFSVMADKNPAFKDAYEKIMNEC